MRNFKTIAAFAAFACFLLALGTQTHAAESKLVGHAMGSDKAPITVHEFVSLTCPHCGDFTQKILPELKKRYIDTGKVRIVFHDFPLDGNALKAAAVARCMPEEQFFPFINSLYSNIAGWALAKDPEKAIMQYANLGGLSSEKAKACISDTKMLDTIVAEREAAEEKYKIQATPTFVINDGAERITGEGSVEDFAAAFDRLLAVKH